MPYYCVQSKATTGTLQANWVHTDSCKTACELVALNVSGVQSARDKTVFDCFEDDTKAPPLGMIYSDTRGPIPIMI